VIRFIGMLLISAMFQSPALAQESADLTFILKSNPITRPQSPPTLGGKGGAVIRLNFEETSELKLFSTGLIRLYQKFIATQDLPVCNFTPGCSRFGMGSIQKYGFLRGVLLIADRLLRDHGMISAAHYPIDADTGKYADAIEDYSREALRK